jgi:putative NADPH-quinone reductase
MIPGFGRRRRPRTLVVICHPKPNSLTRVAGARVVTGIEHAGCQLRVLDLDAMNFDPVLRLAEVRDHLGSPDARPDLA